MIRRFQPRRTRRHRHLAAGTSPRTSSSSRQTTCLAGRDPLGGERLRQREPALLLREDGGTPTPRRSARCSAARWPPPQVTLLTGCAARRPLPPRWAARAHSAWRPRVAGVLPALRFGRFRLDLRLPPRAFADRVREEFCGDFTRIVTMTVTPE